MQASVRWTPPGGALGTICRAAEGRARSLTAQRARLEREAATSAPGPSLQSALREASVSLIAEIKRRSPSKGPIATGLNAVQQARMYAEGGAAAVSVLTEPAHFGGDVADLADVLAGVTLPALKKDFHVHPVQLLEARALGASAALLIARALAPDLLVEMIRVGADLGIELVVEVRDEAELERALSAGASMIGVNNRDLESLVIDPRTAERIIPLVPDGLIAIAESGMRSRADVERYARCGADAVLVGSALSGAADPATTARELTGVPTRSRG